MSYAAHKKIFSSGRTGNCFLNWKTTIKRDKEKCLTKVIKSRPFIPLIFSHFLSRLLSYISSVFSLIFPPSSVSSWSLLAFYPALSPSNPPLSSTFIHVTDGRRKRFGVVNYKQSGNSVLRWYPPASHLVLIPLERSLIATSLGRYFDLLRKGKTNVLEHSDITKITPASNKIVLQSKEHKCTHEVTPESNSVRPRPSSEAF